MLNTRISQHVLYVKLFLIFIFLLNFVWLLLSQFIVASAIVSQNFLSEGVDGNPFRNVDQCIEKIDYDDCYGDGIGESKRDREEDDKDYALEEIDGDKHQGRDQKLLRTFFSAKDDAEERNQSEGIGIDN